jgi:hypothetical protein
LPAQRRQTDAVGVQLDARVKGNVEITTGYEILQADKPATGHGVGFELYVMTDTPTKEGLGLLRASRVNEGDVYLTSRITSRSGKREYHHSFTPTTSTSGQLRLTRVGREATLSAADGPTGVFKDIGQFDLGSEDLTLVRLSAYTGHAAYAVDVLIKDLRVRTLGAGEVAQVAATSEAPPASTERRRGWFAAFSIIFVLVALAAVAAWAYARRSRPVDAFPGASIQGVCPGCGRSVRARPALAGKKIRCPACQGIVELPATVG